MNETLVTLVGNAATAVEFRETATGGMARFRMAATPRRWDREKQHWADGHTSFYTVWAWRTLASNLAGSVSVGEPLVVHGRLKVREEERDGAWKTSVDIEAVAVGHDLTRGTAAFRRVVRGEPSLTARRPRPPGSSDRGEADSREAGSSEAGSSEAGSAAASRGAAGRGGASTGGASGGAAGWAPEESAPRQKQATEMVSVS
ncbi:single-stranded DNA-binding protein [Streptomyces sp. NBC_00683]|uniref:single-stranded DNA-binding protein n=1 Tax=Streptomyces sp. NBC_00683 TaxID=2903670 RepID=UPI002E3308FC|nr:single-stranded DNA-binding protein [Streptomyces sp. NBC_00683]